MALSILSAIPLQAQALPTGFARGIVLENRSSGLAGEFSLDSAAKGIFLFRCDTKTWIERENQRIPAASLRVGEQLEVVSDRDSNVRKEWHYARMVKVIPAVKRNSHRSNGEHAQTRGIPELSNFNYSGIVIWVSQDSLILRTRFDGEKTIFLRQDTQLLHGGDRVERSVLLPPVRVLVNGGVNANGESEAYQVIWGSILEPADLPGRP